jgi:hypothetical protein
LASDASSKLRPCSTCIASRTISSWL